MLWIIIGIIGSYFIGSIPTAYIFGRVLKGVDIRKFGSGNVGATNAMRLLGKPAGIAVLLLDVFKGFFATVVWSNFIISKAPGSAELMPIILGFCCIMGHNWTVFLNFKGGKGVATTLGMLLGLAVKTPPFRLILGLALLVWIVVFLLTRIVSISSIATAITLPVFMVLFHPSPAFIALSILLSLMLILRHKSNLKRILRKEEKKLF